MRVKSKFLSYLLTGAMVLSLTPAVGAKEAKAGEPVNVYVKISSDLSDKFKVPNIHYWGSASTNWPGVQMNGTPNMGWYYYEVPAGAANFLVVNTADNTTSPQTDDATLPSADGWFELIKDSDAKNGYSLKTVTKPSDWVDVPTEDTSGSGSSGTTDENPPSDSTGTGTTDENPPSDSTGTGTTDTNPPSDSTGSGDTGAVDSKEPSFTVHFKNSDSWEKVGIYFNDGSWTKLTGEWPGEEIKLEVGSKTWYEFDYVGDATEFNYIINDNGEGKQTINIENAKQGEYWVTLGDVVTEEEASTVPERKGDKGKFKVNIVKDKPSDYDGQGLPSINWNDIAVKISTEYMEKGSKETAVFDVGNETVIDNLVIGTIAGNDVNVEFKVAGGLVWKVNGKDIDKATKTLNLGATLNTKNIPEETINTLKKDNEFADAKTLTLDHNGDFGAKLQLLFPAGKDKAGKKFQLFYYNPTTKALEKQGDAVEADENGNVPFTFTHASDYVIAEEKTAAAPAATVAPGKKADVIVHVNFGANEAWSAINAYSWTKGGDVKFLGEWPGSAMSKNEKNAGWYSIAFDVNGADEVNIIFNDGNGTQTVDLKLSAATGEFWYTLGEKDADGKFAATESTTKPEGWVDSDVASSNGTGTTGTSSPKTGDNSKAPIAAAVMVLAIAGGVIAYRKREMFI